MHRPQIRVVKSNRGFLLVTALWAAVVAITLLQVSIARGTVELKSVERSIQQTLAFQRAEGTMDAALQSFFTSTDPASWAGCDGVKPDYVPGYTTSSCFVNPLSNPIVVSGGPAKKITVQAFAPTSANPTATRRIQVLAQYPESDFTLPIAADQQIVLLGNALVDGYDSGGVGNPYAFTGDLNGMIRTNGTSSVSTSEAIRLRQDALVYGDAIVGYGGSQASFSLASGAAILGTTFGNPPAGNPNLNCAIPGRCVTTSSSAMPTFDSVTLPTTSAPSGPAINLTGCTVASPPVVYTAPFNFSSITTGQYCKVILQGDGIVNLSLLDLSGSNDLTFNGNIQLQTGSLTVGQWGTIDVGANYSAEVYVNGNVNLMGQTYVNENTKQPKKFSLKVKRNIAITNQTVQLDQNNLFYGTIYAPDAIPASSGTFIVTIAGSAHVFGAIVGKVVQVNQYGQVHYDINLASGGGGSGGSSSRRILSWRDCVSDSDCPAN